MYLVLRLSSTCTSSFFFQDTLGTRWDITGVSFGSSERFQPATSSYGAGFIWVRDWRTTPITSISCNGRNIHRHDKWPLCVTVLCTGSQVPLIPSAQTNKEKGIASPRYSRRAVFLKLSARCSDVAARSHLLLSLSFHPYSFWASAVFSTGLLTWRQSCPLYSCS